MSGDNPKATQESSQGIPETGSENIADYYALILNKEKEYGEVHSKLL